MGDDGDDGDDADEEPREGNRFITLAMFIEILGFPPLSDDEPSRSASELRTGKKFNPLQRCHPNKQVLDGWDVNHLVLK